MIDKVTAGAGVGPARAPGCVIDGEFQVDTAIVPEVAAKKVKAASEVAGQANVLVFPDLNTGNIAYKLTQYMAGAHGDRAVPAGLCQADQRSVARGQRRRTSWPRRPSCWPWPEQSRSPVV